MITCTFENGSSAKLRHVVVHGIAEKDGEILLVRRAARLLEGGKWSLPSGFLDRDETAAACIVRELLEETGWQSEAGLLFRVNTNPDRPAEDRQNVAFDYLVRPIAKVGEGDDESSEIRWFPVSDLPPLTAIAFDHGDSIRSYLSYRTEPFPLPLIF